MPLRLSIDWQQVHNLERQEKPLRGPNAKTPTISPSFKELLPISSSEFFQVDPDLPPTETSSTKPRIEPDDYQKPPPGSWDIWIFKGGRGSGKTLGGADFVAKRLEEEGAIRIGVMAPTNEDARLTCAEGESGLLTLYPHLFKKYNRSSGGGGEAWTHDGGYVRFLGSEKPARWNGPQWNYLWVDEAELCNPQSLEQADFGVRLGKTPCQAWTTTPKGSRYVKLMQTGVRPDGKPHGLTVKVTRATIYDNKHLDPRVVARWEAKYKGTALGKSQLEGLDLDVPEGACWPLLGTYRERYLTSLSQAMLANPDAFVWHRHIGGMDWGTSESHLASMPIASITKTGDLWVRRWFRSGAGSSKEMIDWLKERKQEMPELSAMAIDRSQWSMADWVQMAGVVPIKGDRDVDWRVSLVQGETEKRTIFFDADDPDVREAFDFLIGYHRYEEPHPKAGQIEEVADDDADALAYLVAEAIHPTIDAYGKSVENREVKKEQAVVSQYRFTDPVTKNEPRPPRPDGKFAMPGRKR